LLGFWVITVTTTVKLGCNEQLGTSQIFSLTGLIYIVTWPFGIKNLLVITECSL